jgi:hypothetical protein
MGRTFDAKNFGIRKEFLTVARAIQEIGQREQT